ncbi:hypothetical protein EI94DRAFT_1714828 [Lactarius quietus]|nr:hypothetical protein EI94DRAFT_1714828 [Lactarius quietus]
MMAVLTRCLLCKGDLAGWEVMELFAGGVNQSDKCFNEFATTIGTLLGDDDAPAELRHEVLQLAIIFMCGVNQLSPGAYLLREDLFPAIVASDAARLNPFLHRIGEITDVDVFRKVCWTAEFTSATTIKAYQDISDDSPPTMSSMVGSFMSSLRPDRAFSSTPVNTPKELFKDQPIEACIILLPIFEFVLRNRAFPSILMEGVLDAAETKEIIRVLCESSPHPVRLCRQTPNAPICTVSCPLICAVLDCCILWLRHNLHKRLETSLYLTCVRTCHQTIWFMQKEHIRLLTSTTGIEQLLQESLALLDIASAKAEIFLLRPRQVCPCSSKADGLAAIFYPSSGTIYSPTGESL